MDINLMLNYRLRAETCTFTVQSIVDHGVLFTYTGQEVSIYQNKSN